jgi:UDPglucose 6-dehydrogenase
MILGVVGYGYVGKAVVEGFRHQGFKVYVNDIDDNRSAKAFIDVCDKKMMVQKCDAIFVCVGTPEGLHGNIDLYQVNNAVDKLAFYSSNGRVVKKPLIIIKSTVVPGTTKTYASLHKHLTFAVNPEFMTQMSAATDFLHPDRLVFGVETETVKNVLDDIYASWTVQPKMWVDFKTAELIKYLSNAALVLKVAFACEVQQISKLLECDAATVMNGVTFDKRINKSHLNPALGKIPAGSPCLPKDLSALIQFLRCFKYDSHLLQVALENGVEQNGKN